MSNEAQPILLVGITMRMLAELAVRAGYGIFTIDYFGDLDLRALCPGKSLLRDYGSVYTAAALVDAAVQLETPAVVYGASLENHPEQVARLAHKRQLFGNLPTTLERARNPLLLAETLPAGGFRFPQTLPVTQKPESESGKRWLWKPWRSGGGHAVQFWNGQTPSAEGVLQEWLLGMVGSAVFVANGRGAVLLGVTEQLVGQSFTAASGFRYCGNVLPPPLPPDELEALTHTLRQIVCYLTPIFGLQGLNGLDFIWHNGQVWSIEVNPRPTASMELVDSAYNLRVFDIHVNSFAGRLPSFDLERALSHSPAAGKAIVYAGEDVTVGNTSQWAGWGIRDVPYPGEEIRQGRPVCTVLATAATPVACKKELRSRVTNLRASGFEHISDSDDQPVSASALSWQADKLRN